VLKVLKVLTPPASDHLRRPFTISRRAFFCAAAAGPNATTFDSLLAEQRNPWGGL
jgi:hypothetical protein